MTFTCHRLVFLLAASSALSSALFSQDANKWSRVEINSSHKYTVVITDKVVTVGRLLIRKLDQRGRPTGDDPAELRKPNQTKTLDGNAKYDFYFYTSDKTTQIALKFKLQNDDDPEDAVWFRVSNVGKTIGAAFDVGDVLEIGAINLSNTHIRVNPAAFRNSKGGTFISVD